MSCTFSRDTAKWTHDNEALRYKSNIKDLVYHTIQWLRDKGDSEQVSSVSISLVFFIVKISIWLFYITCYKIQDKNDHIRLKL